MRFVFSKAYAFQVILYIGNLQFLELWAIFGQHDVYHLETSSNTFFITLKEIKNSKYYPKYNRCSARYTLNLSIYIFDLVAMIYFLVKILIGIIQFYTLMRRQNHFVMNIKDYHKLMTLKCTFYRFYIT